MNHQEFIVFLTQIFSMVSVAWVFGYLMRRLNQPMVLGELIGGVLLGPTLFGNCLPDLYAGLFPEDSAITTARDALLRVGMLFFMFSAGLEVNLKSLEQRKSSAILASLLGGGLPFIFGYFSVRLYPEFWGGGAASETLALFMGTALSISALPVIARMLMEMGLIREGVGIVVMTAAMVNDLFGWSLFAVILHGLGRGGTGGNMAMTLGAVAGFSLLLVALGRWVVQPLLRRANLSETWPGGLLTLCSVLVFMAAIGAEELGIHAIFGAFLVGVALGQGARPEEEVCIHRIIQPFALSFFAPLYFVSVGLKVDFSAHFNGSLVLAVFLIACVGKILGGGIGARLGGLPPRESLAVGMAMNARGAIEIIMASVALEYGLIGPQVFVALVIMAFATVMVSGPSLKHLVKPARLVTPAADRTPRPD